MDLLLISRSEKCHFCVKIFKRNGSCGAISPNLVRLNDSVTQTTGHTVVFISPLKMNESDLQLVSKKVWGSDPDSENKLSQ